MYTAFSQEKIDRVRDTSGTGKEAQGTKKAICDYWSHRQLLFCFRPTIVLHALPSRRFLSLIAEYLSFPPRHFCIAIIGGSGGTIKYNRSARAYGPYKRGEPCVDEAMFWGIRRTRCPRCTLLEGERTGSWLIVLWKISKVTIENERNYGADTLEPCSLS